MKYEELLAIKNTNIALENATYNPIVQGKKYGSLLPMLLVIGVGFLLVLLIRGRQTSSVVILNDRRRD